MFKLPLLPPINETSSLGSFLVRSKGILTKFKHKSVTSVNADNLPLVKTSSDTLYFLHIPKTAGTSLLAILDDKFDYDEICDRHDWGELITDIPSNFAYSKLFRGHFGYGFYHQFIKKPIYLTMLRDPIKQIPSHYEQSRRNYRVRFNKEPQKDSLLEFLNHPRRSLIARNMQTRHVAVDIDSVKTIKKLNDEEFGNFIRFNHESFKQPKIRPVSLLDNAKRNLEEFAFVGITERFEESMQLLCYTFGWKPIKQIPQLNVTPKTKRNLTEDELKAVNNATGLDRKLYDFAKKLFNKRYQAMLDFLSASYKENTSVSPEDSVYDLLEQHYQKTFWQDKPKMEKISYDFSQALMGDGWYPRERSPITKKFFRWTGPDKISTIDLPLKTSNDVSVKFYIGMYSQPDLADSLQLQVNDSSIALTKNETFDKKHVFSGNISSSVLKQNEFFTRFVFKIENTIRPNDLDPESSDYRKLGLAFERIQINPLS